MNEVLTRDGNGPGFDSRQVHQFTRSIMELTKYQKAYLLEYMWNVHEDKTANGTGAGSGENTCWLQIDREDGRIFHEAKKLLNYNQKDLQHLKILVVAHRGSTASCPKRV